MATGFLHGVETFPLTEGPVPIQQVRTGVIGIVGTAPVHRVSPALVAPALNTPTIITSEVTAPKFGPTNLPGYTIPRALAALGKYAGPVIVINVFDPVVHKGTAAEATLTITAAKTIALAHGDILTHSVKTTADVVCVEGTDYTLDRDTGVVSVLPSPGKLAAAASAKVAFTYADPAAVDHEDIEGGVDGAGLRTGASALLNARALNLPTPKILIAPVFSSTRSVAVALLAVAKKLRAVVFADAPAGSALDDVIAARGTETEGIDLGIQDDQLFYCYPYLKTTRGLEPLSTHLAGVTAQTDSALGYWHTPSNKQFSAEVTGLELPLTAAYNDENCDVNRLNAAGIVTAFASVGSPLKAWGNRASSFPASQSPMTFVSVLRVRHMLDETIENASGERFSDRPINKPLIDGVLADTNELVNTLIGRGALMPGSATSFIPDKNPAVEIAAGKVTFTNRWASPTPAEHITWDSIYDTKLLAQGT